jgi:aryl-alcohol dehydrogenase-like predicted oxidoreductase
VLSELGHEVVEVEAADELLERCRATAPDVAVIDGSGGMDALARLKADPDAYRTAVILIERADLDLDAAVAALRRGVDLGLKHIDTAELYGGGEVEEMVAEAITGRRSEVFLVSKVLPSNASRRGTVAACERSLKRLRTDRIDLLYQHRVDPAVPMEDVAGTVGDLIREGKVGHFGLSEAGPQNIRRAHAVQPVTAIQNHYSLWMREPERGALDLCEELGIGFVAWGPLGQGFLTGAITRGMRFDDPNDLRKDFPRFTPEALEANFKVVDFLKDLAARKGATPARVALAWLLARKPFVVPIPGGTKVAHLDDNLPAAELQLSADDLREIDEAFSELEIQGAPLSAALDSQIDR